MICLFALGLVIYSNVLRGEFISDDYVCIVNNMAIRDIADWGALWRALPTRFLFVLSLAGNYALGKLDVFGYHLVNILLHIVNAVLVFAFARVTFQTPGMRDVLDRRAQEQAAFLAALIFLCHPIQTQGVSFIMQRAVSLATCFYLLTLVSYARYRLTAVRGFFGLAVLAMSLAILSKEMTITIPVTLAVYEAFFFGPWRQGTFRKALRLLPFFLLAGALPLILTQDRPGSILEFQGQIAHRTFQWRYFLTEVNVLRTYLRLLVLPIHQIHDYDYPLVRGVGELRTFFSLGVLAALVGFGVKIFRRQRLLSFCVFWFFITTSVEAVVVCFVNRGVIYEQWLYLPMVGFALFFAYGLQILLAGHRGYYRLAGLAVVGVLSLLTYQRNFIWQNEIALWEEGIRQAPRKAMVYFAAGAAYQRKNLDARAMQYYKKAAELSAQDAVPMEGVYASRLYNNIGVLYARHRKDRMAAEAFQKALASNPRNGEAHNNLGILSFETGRYELAIKSFESSLALQGDYPYAYFYLGQAYAALGQDARSQENLNRALALARKYDDGKLSQIIEDVLRGR